ncbi:MAG: hypothetical protein DI533_17120 [Cereibacter sphaeroides]|uniref:Uncharacterized protein n=1 Tax=Cereibacter sphaeroides TaxID=1063 RepID=A0A2W5TKC2_CERSP|nr:MAG: hypothetical protein DI533_17120 [Cereibacter sphaeroides]
MTRFCIRSGLLLLWFGTLGACSGVETGAVSPCLGQFRAEGKYFTTKTLSDSTRVVLSTKNPTVSSCGD